MENPWRKLPDREPFVLEQDRPFVEQHNAKAKPEHFIHTKLLPEPFLGNPDAPVVLLNLNPGYNEKDLDSQDARFTELSQDNRLHRGGSHPFYLLNPEIENSLAYQWWDSRLRELIKVCGRECVAQNVFAVEMMPYHSAKYKPLVVPSQAYSFELVRRAIQRRAVIVQMFGKNEWPKCFPELLEHQHYYRVNGRGVYVTPRSCPEGFPAIVETLKRHA
ncbi:MAG TPA: hypothetical protein PKD09_23010 [Aggregatilinea sp.]|uniref:hypothetical protein n=1 Tax=Aggregatilinea sp. TaxID=2806333 RepID=UPI002CE8A0E5|nr:hypothetical protein [Aggregatilinea sp.]HML24541.1 hypothetical protein [Aggregatilinea sp.]